MSKERYVYIHGQVNRYIARLLGGELDDEWTTKQKNEQDRLPLTGYFEVYRIKVCYFYFLQRLDR